MEIVFGEYYNLRRDRFQLRNLLHDGAKGNVSHAKIERLHRWLNRMRHRRGRH
jgi:hypothetical protein